MAISTQGRLMDEELTFFRVENAKLAAKVAELEARLLYMTTYKTLAAGLSGENHVVELIGGARTSHTASVDIICRNGTKVEVKLGKLSRPAPRTSPDTLRWQWGKIFGEKNAKDFDYIVLVGESDLRFRELYKDRSSPYVLFLLNRAQAEEVATSHTRGAKGILLGANPQPKGVKAARFFAEFQVTAAELTAWFTDDRRDV